MTKRNLALEFEHAANAGTREFKGRLYLKLNSLYDSMDLTEGEATFLKFIILRTLTDAEQDDFLSVVGDKFEGKPLPPELAKKAQPVAENQDATPS